MLASSKSSTAGIIAGLTLLLSLSVSEIGYGQQPAEPQELAEVQTVQIGDLVWTARNLDIAVAESVIHPDNPNDGSQFGRLYNFDEARRVAEKLGDGWRIPTDSDWKKLCDSFSGTYPDPLATQTYEALVTDELVGFHAQLGGVHLYFPDKGGVSSFRDFGTYGYYWTSTRHKAEVGYDDVMVSYSFRRNRPDSNVLREWCRKKSRISLRCVKDAKPEPGRQVTQRTIITATNNDGDNERVAIRYWLYLPTGFTSEAADRYPVLLFLHGQGSRAKFIERPTNRADPLSKVHVVGPPKLVADGGNLPFILVSPQLVEVRNELANNTKRPRCTECSTESNINSSHDDIEVVELTSDNFGFWQRDQLQSLVRHVQRQFNGDSSRTYCTGVSLGGFGCWHILEKYHSFFAAGAPVCGGWPMPDQRGLSSVSPADREIIGANLSRIPIRTFHRCTDNIVPWARTNNLVNLIRSFSNSQVEFVSYEDDTNPANGNCHDAWTNAYKYSDGNRSDDNLYDWFLSHQN